ncbi:MAG: alpha/beta hydrolase [Dehalococcoidia bacterium]
MLYARVNGIDLHYQDLGAGFPLVFVHGYTGDLRNWDLQLPAVLSQGYRAILLDLRGHGESEKPPRSVDYTLELMAQDVFALVEQLGLGECYLIGHSMGGMIAQRLILAHPDPFRALVLVDTAAGVADETANERRARLAQIARERGMEAVFEELIRIDPLAAELRAEPDAFDAWRQQFLLTSREAYVHCAEAISNRESLLDKVHAISVPTLIVCGADDETYLGPSQRLHERIRGSELAVIAGAGHSPQAEQADEFNRLLSAFLSRVHQTVGAGG